MAYEVKVTRQCQTTIPLEIRRKYKIDEGDSVIYVDLGDHVAMLPVPKHSVKELLDLQIDVKEPVEDMRKEALQTAQRLVEKKFKGWAQILIESDLLLAAIKKEDRLKPVSAKILYAIDSGKLKGVYASTAAIQETIFWLYNRQLFDELIKAVNFLSHVRHIEWISLTPEICTAAALLIGEYNITPFDAYHLATAISMDKTILSTEHIYEKVKGVKKIEPIDFAKNL
jgi:bifunctional DNA-binding transcriptional regulator/antitoxin component of YhaV-PrlF toxin-antitoxin module/predicted nucleic acid-binding protein